MLLNDDYAIWDLEASGEAIEHYPRTEEGWAQALARFEQLNQWSAPGPSVTLPQSKVPGSAILVALGGAIAVIGSFLPWITASAPFVGTVSRSGMQGGDGIITLILGLIIAAVGIARLLGTTLSGFLRATPIGLGIVVLIVGILNLVEVNERVAEATAVSNFVTASAGAGLWAVLVGGTVSVLAGWGLRSERRAPRAAG